MKFKWTNCGTTYTGELLGFVCPAGTVCGVMLPADGFVHVVPADTLREHKELETPALKGSFTPDEERIYSFLDDRELAASLLHAYTGYVGTTMEICKEGDCWAAVARAARAHIAPESREPTILQLALTPPHSGTGVPAGKSFQSKIALEAAERVLQNIYQLALNLLHVGRQSLRRYRLRRLKLREAARSWSTTLTSRSRALSALQRSTERRWLARCRSKMSRAWSRLRSECRMLRRWSPRSSPPTKKSKRALMSLRRGCKASHSLQELTRAAAPLRIRWLRPLAVCARRW